MKNSLGILGGLGPYASAYFYTLITQKTKAEKDQDHLNIILLSHASTPDRTNYILDNSNENPFNSLLEDCKTLEKLGCKMITIPCNTASYFHDELQKHINIPISNLVKTTTDYIKYKNYKSAVIMGTEGTIKAGLYQKRLEKENIKCIFPNQEIVTNIIYNYIKKGIPVPEDLWNDTVKNLNADCFILGCTELSILKGNNETIKLNDKFIDPLEIEAKKILNIYQKERL